MYQYHGWAVILESASADGESNDEHEIVQSIKDYIEVLKKGSDIIDIKGINGQYHFWMTGLWNHEPSSKYNPISIMEYIGSKAPGSYGMLYVCNDEDAEHYNEFRAYILSRGKLDEHKDPFLSPLIPVVTDEYELED